MPFISITRLRLRSLRFVPLFALQTQRTLTQVKAARGFQGGSLLPDRKWTFWTMTAWDNLESMRSYMTSGSHKSVMPKLMSWCDEASVVHWVQTESALPTWEHAEQRMRNEGRISKVRYPSPQHATLTFDPARTSRAAPIHPSPR